MELRFHFEEKCFYQENGELQEESGETLEELEEHYENMCNCYNKLPEPKKNEKGEVDWEEDDNFQLGLAQFNISNGIDMLEWEIDLKLLHLEKRKNANKPYPKWDYKTIEKCNESCISDHNNEIFKAGGYISPKGYCVDIPADDPMLQATKIYSQEFNVNDVDRDYYFDDNYKRIVRQETPISVENEGCFVVARKMCRNSKAVIISLIKDEALSIRSNYSLLLMQNSGASPLGMNFGGIYSPDVTVFRKGEKDFYNLMDEVHKVNIITVEAPDGEFAQEGLAIMKNKIRTIYRIALSNNHRELVIGHFLCQAFHLPEDEVINLFKEVLQEQEFLGKFSEIHFAIPDKVAGDDNCKN